MTARAQKHGQLSALARKLATSPAADRARIPVDRPCPVRAKPFQLDGMDPRPRAPGRDPCPHCAARGDLGCDHYAPCFPADLPREATGILNEKGQLRRGASHNG